MPKLKWRVSYETLKFNTPDGDLDRNQFCRFKNGHLIRTKPKNNAQFDWVETLNTTGMQEVFVAEERGAYYDEFALPSGRIFRISSTKQKYWDVAKIPNHPQPEKEVTEAEIQEIIKDDHLWL